MANLGNLFDYQMDRRSSGGIKWTRYEENILPLWVADMDFKAPPAILKAIQDFTLTGDFGYPGIFPELTSSTLSWLEKRHGWKVDEKDLVFLPGVVTGFNLAAFAVTNPGAGVVVQTPTYGPFLRVANNHNLIQETSPLIPDRDGYYQIDFDDLEEKISEKSRIFMLCNPQNPTGRVFDKDELTGIAEICLKNELIICSDEIHSDLVYSPNKHIPIASLSPEIAQNTITLIAPSKTFNIPGLKSSIAIIQNSELRRKFINARRDLVGWVNSLGQIATIAAYGSSEDWLDALIIYLSANRDYLYQNIHDHLPGMISSPPEGTYLAWLNLENYRLGFDPGKFLLANGNIAVNSGGWFGKSNLNYVRLNFACPRNTLENALLRVKNALLHQK